MSGILEQVHALIHSHNIICCFCFFLRNVQENTLGSWKLFVGRSNTADGFSRVLAQVRRKVSKEQNTVVQVGGEGQIELKMRVFVANSVEARAVSDYISSHSNQVLHQPVVHSLTRVHQMRTKIWFCRVSKMRWNQCLKNHLCASSLAFGVMC
jgi:hypothetical protein